MRGDIPFGNQAAQIIHAAGESSPGDLDPGTFAVALKARDEAHLREISERLFSAGVKHKRIIESDEPYANQLMAIGIFPMERDKVKSILSSLPLVR